MVSPIAPLFQWKDGKLKSPAEVAREQRVAEALMFAKPQGEGFWGALGQVASAASGSLLDSRADASEQQGREAAANLFSGLGSGASTDAIAQALMAPEAAWATPAQSGVAEALLGANLKQQDPMYQLQLQQAQLELEQMRNPQPQGVDPTAAMQNYQFLIANGVDPQQAMAMSFGGDAPVVNVNNGQPVPDVGTIPPGMMLRRDENGMPIEMLPIPNSQQEMEREAAERTLATGAGRRDTATEIITGAASEARKVLNSGGVTTGSMGAVVSLLPESNAAELRRQVEVLKANATIENLTAMRQASPTGGALGSVTEKEGAMLAAASGAIDPNASAEQFERALDNYERTLLRVVHGPVEGERLYKETRPRSSQPASGGGVDDILKGYGL